MAKSDPSSGFERRTGAALSGIGMLTVYRMNVGDNVPAHLLRQIRKEVDAAPSGAARR